MMILEQRKLENINKKFLNDKQEKNNNSPLTNIPIKKMGYNIEICRFFF